MVETYSEVGGCSVMHPFNKTKRKRCEDAWYAKQAGKTAESQAELVLAQAAQAQVTQAPEEDKWSPMAVGLVTAGSLLAIGLMVLIIRRARRKK